MSVGFPAFGIGFFLSNAAFLIFTGVFMLVFMFKAKVSQIEVSENDPEYDEENSNLVNYWNFNE